MLAGLTLGGLLAGFVFATSALGTRYTPVGSIDAPGRAYALAVDGSPLRFGLQGEGLARFVLYDGSDALAGVHELRADERVDLEAPEPGLWVLLVTATYRARLVVSLGGDIDAGAHELLPVPLDEERLTLVTQDAGPLDLATGLELERRPALASLSLDGQTRAFEAVLRSELGPVHTLRGDALPGGPGPAERAAPGHLAAGDYEVEARAEAFSGRLEAVMLSYDRAELERLYAEEGDGLVERPRPIVPPDLLEEGALVAEMGAGQAVLLDTQGARTVLFATERASSAEVLVFNETNHVIAVLELGRGSGEIEWDFSEAEEEETGADLQVHELVLERPRELVLYVDRVRGGTETVWVLLDDVASPRPARPLSVEPHEVALRSGGIVSEDQLAATVTVLGGLVGVTAQTSSVAATTSEVRVAGPRGVVYERFQGFGALGLSYGATAEEFPDRLSGGRFEVSLDGEGAELEAVVRLYAYTR